MAQHSRLRTRTQAGIVAEMATAAIVVVIRAAMTAVATAAAVHRAEMEAEGVTAKAADMSMRLANIVALRVGGASVPANSVSRPHVAQGCSSGATVVQVLAPFVTGLELGKMVVS